MVGEWIERPEPPKGYVDKSGGPAFPEELCGQPVHGMTLRDYFAAAAMAAIMSDHEMFKNFVVNNGNTYEAVAKDAYAAADAMIAIGKG